MSSRKSDGSERVWMSRLLLLAVLLGSTKAATVSGRVVDALGKPVAGVAVVLEGRGRSASTDGEGRFAFVTVGVGPAAGSRVHGQVCSRRRGPVLQFGASRATADGRTRAGAYGTGGMVPLESDVDAIETGSASGGLAKRTAAWDTLGFSKAAYRPRRLLVGAADTALGDVLLHPEFTGALSNYLGFNRYDFQVGGRAALVVVPRKPAPGSPWIWRTYFWNHKPRFDSIMASRGYHLAFIDAPNLFGAPEAVAAMDGFYDRVTKGHGLGRKPTLVGISRGGLYAYRWAMAHPDRVSSIYGDAPVMDFVSWPCGCYGTGKGSAGDWTMLKNAYGFGGDAEAKAFAGNPYASAKLLAQAGIPLIHVYGETDDVVPPRENTLRANDSLKAYGRPMKLLPKPGIGHVHGLSASDGGLPGQMDTLVNFVIRNTID